MTLIFDSYVIVMCSHMKELMLTLTFV